MKFTNVLLIIIIILFVWKNNFPVKEKSVSKKLTPVAQTAGITVGKSYVKTKDVTPTVKNNNEIKHSTTLRNYTDTSGRQTYGLTHNIRVGKDYYVSGTLTHQTTSYDKENLGANISVTKYW